MLLCGDIQALRNEADLDSLAVPDKFKRLGDFHRYYSGEKTAPILTLGHWGESRSEQLLVGTVRIMLIDRQLLWWVARAQYLLHGCRGLCEC